MIKFITIPLASLLLALTAPLALAQQAPAAPPSKGPGVVELRKTLQESYAAEDWFAYLAAAKRLNALRPNNGQYMYHVVIAHALVGDLSGAYAMMLEMQKQGLSYDFDASKDTIPIRRTQVYSHVNELLKIQGEPMGFVEPWYELGPEVKAPGAMAWDPTRNAMLLGTTRDGALFSVSQDGGTRELLRADGQNGLWGIHGVLVDAERGRLWIASAADRGFAGFDPVDTGRSALFEFDLETLELLRRVPVPVDGRPHHLGAMVQGEDGTIYVADGIIPILYALPAGEDRLKIYFMARNLVNLRDLALSPDGRLLYFADYEMGIGVLDLQNEQAFSLETPETFNLGGIDGIAMYDNYLVVLQNGNSPQRIMRLELEPGGLKVASVAPMAVADPAFDFPSLGVMVDDDLVFVANSRFDPASGQPVTISSSPVNEVALLMTTPDIEKFKRDYEEVDPDYVFPDDRESAEDEN